MVNVKLIQDLRRSGKSINEIVSKTGSVKSTVWRYIKGMPPPNDIRKRNSEVTRRRWAKEREATRQEAEKEFERFCREPEFMLGLGIYWGEGRKTEGVVEVANTDFGLLVSFKKWAEKYMNVKKWRMTIRGTHKDVRYIEKVIGLCCAKVYALPENRTRQASLHANAGRNFLQLKLKVWLAKLGSLYVNGRKGNFRKIGGR